MKINWMMRAVRVLLQHSLTVQCSRSTRNTWHVRAVIGFIKTSFVTYWAIGIGINNVDVCRFWHFWTLHGLTDNSIRPLFSLDKRAFFIFDCEMNGTVHYAVVALWDKSEYKIIADYSVDQNPNYRNIALNIFDSRTDKNDKIDSGG